MSSWMNSRTRTLPNMRLVRQLASFHKNIFCVGDPDQSIYAWRGADWRNVQRFEQDFLTHKPSCSNKIIVRDKTFLTPPWALSTAPRPQAQRLFTDRGEGEKVFFYEAPDDYAEASFVVDAIAQLVASRQFEPGNCAVMYRTNAMSRLLEEAFLQAGCHRLLGHNGFMDGGKSKMSVAFLRLIHNPADEASLDRVINVPPRRIGDKTLLTLHTVARQDTCSPALLLLIWHVGQIHLIGLPLPGALPRPLQILAGMLATWRASAPSLTTSELFDRVLRDLD